MQGYAMLHPTSISMVQVALHTHLDLQAPSQAAELFKGEKTIKKTRYEIVPEVVVLWDKENWEHIECSYNAGRPLTQVQTCDETQNTMRRLGSPRRPTSSRDTPIPFTSPVAIAPPLRRWSTPSPPASSTPSPPLSCDACK